MRTSHVFGRYVKLFLLPLLLCAAFLVTGCSTVPKPKQTARLHLQAVDDGKRFNRPSMKITMPSTQTDYYINPNPIISEGDIANIELARVDLGLCIQIDVLGRASNALFQNTVGYQGLRLFLLVDGKPVAARVIDGPIQGTLYMFLDMDEDKVANFVWDLKESCAKYRKALAER